MMLHTPFKPYAWKSRVEESCDMQCGVGAGGRGLLKRLSAPALIADEMCRFRSVAAAIVNLSV